MNKANEHEENNKDHLKKGVVAGLIPIHFPKSDGPLLFWTNSASENTLVDLRPFEIGVLEKDKYSTNWGGGFSGRPVLIAELAPVLRALCEQRSKKTTETLLTSLRAWWRLFDLVENSPPVAGRSFAKVVSVSDISRIHEVAGHKNGIGYVNFRFFTKAADIARMAQGLPELGWIFPAASQPSRQIIPDDMSRELKIAIKQDWEMVRNTWEKNDKIRTEAECRARGESASVLDEDETIRLKNWQYYREIQKKYGVLIPSGRDLEGGWGSDGPLARRGLNRTLMRSIAFPNVEEADIAFHVALIHSGWNPSTMLRVDANNPFLIGSHPKSNEQLVLNAESDDFKDGESDEITLHASKPRARGQTQYCMGKKSHLASAPAVVNEYLKRVRPLREIVRKELISAQKEYNRLIAINAKAEEIARQLKIVQKLQFDSRSVWLYLDREANVASLRISKNWNRYPLGKGRKKFESYLDRVRNRLNRRRAEKGLVLIPKVVPSDFRDIFSRWIYLSTNGNLLAVQMSLGHRRMATTGLYLDNNIFASESDEAVRRWGTNFFEELGQGRVDLTILAQVVRHGPLTEEMESRLNDYRQLLLSRVGARCVDPRNPPPALVPDHIAGRLCGTQRCLIDCRNAKFLPESLNSIAMRCEELLVMMDYLPRESFLRGRFDQELESAEVLLQELFQAEAVADARAVWRQRIAAGEHLIPELGRISIEARNV